MDDYAAWRTRVLHGAHLSAPQGPVFSESGLSTSPVPPPPPPPPPPPNTPAVVPPRRDESGTAAAPPLLFSSGDATDTDDAAGAAARLAAVLRDITATERHHAKTWMNVQPCVLHAVKLLASTAQHCIARVAELEEAVRQAQQCVNVLVRDREVKEERYRLDASAHRAEVDELWKRLLALEGRATRQEQQQQQQQLSAAAPQREVSSATAAAINASCAHAVESRLVPLEEELQHLRRRVYQDRGLLHSGSSHLRHGRPHNPEQPRAAYDGSVDSDTASAPTPPPPQSRARSRGARAKVGHTDAGAWGVARPRRRTPSPAASLSSSSLSSSAASARAAGVGDNAREPRTAETTMMMREVQRLRRQWRQFLRSVSGDTVMKGTTAEVDRERHPRGAARGFSSEREGRPKWARSGGSGEAKQKPDALDAWRAGWSRPRPPCCTPFDTCGLDGGGAAEGVALPSSGRRVRWYWSGDARSRFSTATRHAGTAARSASPLSPPPAASAASASQGSVSPPLPWTEYHAFDGRTDCWYSLGTWAAHRRQLREVAEAEGSAEGDARLGWMAPTTSLLEWVEPATVGVVRAGVYAVRVCLVRHCASASLCGGGGRVNGGDGGALSLWLDGVPVAGMQEAVTHTLLYADGRRPPSPPLRAGIAHATAQRRRACCEPAQLHTNVLSALLFLPAGATLQVRCRGLHDTKTIYEAFCELECIV